ncbi:flagellar hook-length control protein FliK [Salipaludibacillus daqingensis]|uniref:flagellar hook-length control protein FliK n=1 Tax=Salipaludibacillus daqingensis TaxID=3041001 RepID=UPI0024739DF9|nr:flagellar hook-length control protein FliK [Salipaludibacillus daqingensis]
MNGMMALMPMVSMSKAPSGMSLTSESGDKESGFMEALMMIMGGSDGADISKDELIDKLGLDSEWVALLLNSSLEELASTLEEPLKELVEILEQLPLDESFLSEDLFEFDEVKQLLEVLPDDWSQKMEELIVNNTSLEGLIEEFQMNGDPVYLLALIASFSANDRTDTDKSNLAFQQMIQQYFPKFTNEDKHQPVRQTLKQLTEFISKGERHLASDARVLPQGQQSFNTNRFAELAYMNQLAGEKGQTKNASPLPNSMMLDTTNSQMARFQTMVMPTTGDAAPERPSQEQFVRQFQNILSRSTFQQLMNGNQQLSVKLHPASLGRMDITIQQVNGVMMATLMTTTKVARDLIEGQLTQLRNAFQSQNIPIDKIEVTQQQNQQQLLKDSNHEEARKQHEKGTKGANVQEDDEEEEQDFADFLENTINTEA